eukprot:Skav224214  [mRNA]  locus=scaffold939:985137:987398:- [translate_table: standard]
MSCRGSNVPVAAHSAPVRRAAKRKRPIPTPSNITPISNGMRKRQHASRYSAAPKPKKKRRLLILRSKKNQKSSAATPANQESNKLTQGAVGGRAKMNCRGQGVKEAKEGSCTSHSDDASEAHVSTNVSPSDSPSSTTEPSDDELRNLARNLLQRLETSKEEPAKKFGSSPVVAQYSAASKDSKQVMHGSDAVVPYSVALQPQNGVATRIAPSNSFEEKQTSAYLPLPSSMQPQLPRLPSQVLHQWGEIPNQASNAVAQMLLNGIKPLIANAQFMFAEEQEQREVAEKELLGKKEKYEAAERQYEELQKQFDALSQILAEEREKWEAAEEESRKAAKELASEKEKRQTAEKQVMEEQEKRHIVEKQLVSEEEKRQTAEADCAILEEQLDVVSLENEKLKEELQTLKNVSCLSQGASWLYENNGCWHEFTREGSEKMHQVYLEYRRDALGNRFATINSGGVAREVDFELMQQKHCTTNKVRKIHFEPGVPSAWVTPALDLLQQGNHLSSFYKEETDPAIWYFIREILTKSGHALDASTDCSRMCTAEINSVHRIENFCLWHRYKARLGAIRQEHARYSISVRAAKLGLDGPSNIIAESQQAFVCGEALALDVDEKILLHGTSWDNANAIAREGFDNRTCQNAFYGAGVYFACAACKSHQYTCEHHKSCCGCKEQRTLIIARVALGDSYTATETRKNQRRAPVRFDASGTAAGTYDSIVVEPGLIKGHHNSNQIHQEYVIFDREQAYPSYVVQYTV